MEGIGRLCRFSPGLLFRLQNQRRICGASLISRGFGSQVLNTDWQAIHDEMQRSNDSVIGCYGGSHAVYHALAEVKQKTPLVNLRKPQSIDGIGSATVKEWTVPHLTNHLKDHRTQAQWNQISSFNPYGLWSSRPTISATLACMQIPEIMNDLYIDGRIVNPDRSINCTKVAIEPVWHLPSIAKRLDCDESTLREALFEWTQIPSMLDASRTVFLPAIGGTTIYLFGDLTAIHDNHRKLSSRPHDECNGSDAFGTDICTCRPYLTYAIEKAVATAQQNGCGCIAYFRKEGRALGEVTKFRVYNMRKYQKGGDRPETYFQMTKNIAGVVDARAQELMPDVFHWLGVKKIDTLLSMSKDKYEAITKFGSIVVESRESLPESLVPAGAHTEISAKISSGYLGFQPRKEDADTERRYLYTLESIRERCKKVFDLGKTGKLLYFDVDMSQMKNTSRIVIDCIKRHYPDLKIPPHSRLRHFESGGHDRLGELSMRWKKFHVDALERTRRRIDLIVVSVLLDAGAGKDWKYTDHSWGEEVYSRSEGLGLASLDMFRNGMFSSATEEQRVDSVGLRALDQSDLERGFQVRANNSLIGLEGRFAMLQRLAQALEASPEIFGSPQGTFRPGHLVDHILKHAYSNSRRVSVRVLWQALIDGLSTVFPDNSSLGLGDAYRYPPLQDSSSSVDNLKDVVPFHKLSQWMAYSLIEPLTELGIHFVDEWLLTGLAEYRNGGLFVDSKLLVPREPEKAFHQSFTVDDPLIVEWRALTVALLDLTAIEIWEKLGKSSLEMPMSCILEGGTWRCGRELAFENREGGTSPILVDSKGDVF